MWALFKWRWSGLGWYKFQIIDGARCHSELRSSVSVWAKRLHRYSLQPTTVAHQHFIKLSDCQHTTGPVVERNAKTAQRPKDVKPATDMLDYCDLPEQSQHPLRQKESPVLLHAVSRSWTGREEDSELKTCIWPLSIVLISLVFSWLSF